MSLKREVELLAFLVIESGCWVLLPQQSHEADGDTRLALQAIAIVRHAGHLISLARVRDAANVVEPLGGARVTAWHCATRARLARGALSSGERVFLDETRELLGREANEIQRAADVVGAALAPHGATLTH